MYVRDGKQMPEPEEGAAFFQPIGSDEPAPQVWGVSPSFFTRGFGFGDDASDPNTIPEVTVEGDPSVVPYYETPVWRFLALAGMGLGAYHGYKRNSSVGWAVVWALLGSIAPVIVIPVAFAQGIGKPKGRS